MMRQRASEYYVSSETVPTPILQRASSRQTSVVVSDYMDPGDVELPSNQRYSW